jgi:hypothetical protein
MRVTSVLRFFGIAILYLVVAHTWGQTAQLSGQVTDSQNAVIAGAELRIVNLATGVERYTQTNGEGYYTAPFLQPNRYKLYVQKQGFETAVSDDLTLTVGQALVMTFQLRVGSTQQQVVVEGGSQLLNTTDAAVSTIIDRKFVENIPLNGRSLQDLISLTPGVVTQSPQASSGTALNGDFSINGQRTESNYYLVDGVSGNISSGSATNGITQSALSGSISSTTALGTTQSLISLDALQEFRIESSSYSAEYGHSPGGQVSFMSRSGTNDFHGSIFDYLRNNFFDANDWFNSHYSKPIAALRQNDFGGSVGGPVRVPRLYNGRDRSFFFLSYEGLRLTEPQAASVQYVPDAFMRQQAPAAIQSILNAFPIQNGNDYGNATSPSLAQFIEPYSVPSQIDSASIRVDHSFGPKLVLFFRASDTPSSTTSRLLSVLRRSNIDTLTYTLGGTSEISPRIDNDLRIGYSRATSQAIQAIDSFGGATPIDLSVATGLGATPFTYPQVVLIIGGVGFSTLQAINSRVRQHQWNFVDSINISRRKHQLRFGVDYRRITSPTIPFSPQISAFFESATAILSNAPASVFLAKRNSAVPIINQVAAFAQDEWRVGPGLSLSLGIRWELDPPPSEANGQDPYTLLGNVYNPASLSLAPRGTPLWKSARYNFAPRLGLAWVAHNHADYDSVIRAGGGVFFDTTNRLAVDAFNGIGFQASHNYFGSSLPITQIELDFSPSATPPFTTGAVYAFPEHLQLPYTLGWNASLQQALGKTQALTISYVGATGRRLIQEQYLSVGTQNANFSTITYIANRVTSNYQALEVLFQRSVAQGINALASYTWSHSLDFGSNDAALPLTRGNSDFDVRNSLQAGVSWHLQYRGHGLVAAVARDWTLDGRLAARTAFPVTIQGNFLTDPITGSEYYGNLDLVPERPTYVYGSEYPGGRTINSFAFKYAADNGSGDAPRNFVRGFGMWQLNLAAQREFPIWDELHLQFRAETFNITNHPNFGYIDPSLTDATFGQATKMLNQSLGTVASQYQQGGPRSFQFALRLVW